MSADVRSNSRCSFSYIWTLVILPWSLFGELSRTQCHSYIVLRVCCLLVVPIHLCITITICFDNIFGIFHIFAVRTVLTDISLIIYFLPGAYLLTLVNMCRRTQGRPIILMGG